MTDLTVNPTVKERPILFGSEMVRAILDGSKTQTRRVIKPTAYQQRYCREKHGSDATNKMAGESCKALSAACHDEFLRRCPYGKPGDRLWVRETWQTVNSEQGPGIAYKADSCFWQPEYDGEDFGAGPSYNYDKYPGEYLDWFTDLLDGEGRWNPFHPHAPLGQQDHPGGHRRAGGAGAGYQQQGRDSRRSEAPGHGSWISRSTRGRHAWRLRPALGLHQRQARLRLGGQPVGVGGDVSEGAG